MRFVSSAKRHPHSGRRGAAFVEALIVISFLILAFMGLTFFREFYVKQLRSTRLARAAVISYSMTGCIDDMEPTQWIGRKDLGTLHAGRPNSVDETSKPENGANQQPATASGEAGSILGKVPGLGAGGDGIINPITTSDVSGTSTVETREGGLLTGQTKQFTANPRSRSFVSCGDKVRDGDFKDVLGYIGGIFNIKVD